MMSLARRLVAEGLGTAFLLAVVIGSGIMGERLAGGNVALALLANSLATGGGLWMRFRNSSHANRANGHRCHRVARGRPGPWGGQFLSLSESATRPWLKARMSSAARISSWPSAYSLRLMSNS